MTTIHATSLTGDGRTVYLTGINLDVVTMSPDRSKALDVQPDQASSPIRVVRLTFPDAVVDVESGTPASRAA